MNWIHRTAFTAVIASRLIFTLAADAPTTMPTVDKPTAALIDQLDSDDYHTRQSAADQLTALGEPIRPVMVALSALGKTPEVQSAAAAVLASLDKIAADRPTMITLHVKGANPRDVFAEIARQSHTDLPLWPPQLWSGPQWGPTPKVTLDIDQEPFWLALDTACQSASAHIQNMGGNRNMTIMQGSYNDMLAGPRSTNGLFIVVADSASRNRQVSFLASGASSRSDSIDFHLFADPKARLLSIQNRATLTLAVDDKGNSLVATNNNLSPFHADQEGSSVSFSAPLRYPDDGYTQAVKLKGTLQVVIASKVQTLEIPDLKAAVNSVHPAGPWIVTVADCQINGASGSYRLKIHTGGTPQAEVYPALQGIRLTDAAGQALNGGMGGNGINTDIEYTANFSASGPIKPPVKLVWDIVTERKTQSVPFEFTDLPLPTP